jgi:hypothetical protein
MAVNTTVNCVFDLGPDWSMYKELQILIIPGWTAGQITYNCTASDSTTITYNRRLVPLSYGGANTTLYITSTTVSGNGGYTRPMGRYVIIQAQTNASGTSDGTGALTVTAYPGV